MNVVENAQLNCLDRLLQKPQLKSIECKDMYQWSRVHDLCTGKIELSTSSPTRRRSSNRLSWFWKSWPQEEKWFQMKHGRRSFRALQIPIAALNEIEFHFMRKSSTDGVNSFWRLKIISRERVATERWNSQFFCTFWPTEHHFSCKRVATERWNSQVLQFLKIEAHFVRKGCELLLQFLTIEFHFGRKCC